MGDYASRIEKLVDRLNKVIHYSKEVTKELIDMKDGMTDLHPESPPHDVSSVSYTEDEMKKDIKSVIDKIHDYYTNIIKDPRYITHAKNRQFTKQDIISKYLTQFKPVYENIISSGKTSVDIIKWSILFFSKLVRENPRPDIRGEENYAAPFITNIITELIEKSQ
jgi:hypothetical protein